MRVESTKERSTTNSYRLEEKNTVLCLLCFSSQVSFISLYTAVDRAIFLYVLRASSIKPLVLVQYAVGLKMVFRCSYSLRTVFRTLGDKIFRMNRPVIVMRLRCLHQTNQSSSEPRP